MSAVIMRLTSPAVLRLVGVSGVAGWLLALVLFYATLPRLVVDDGVVVGRDFMAFYLAGRIVAEGHGTELYDIHRQRRTQDAVLAPEHLDGLAYYINPAPVAVAYSVLARLPYLAALHVNTIGMIAAYACAIFLLARHLSALYPHRNIVAMIGMLWFPMSQTVTGGQNAALTLLLLVVAYQACVRGQAVLAGMALGLLLFKPQYALPFIGLLAMQRQWRTVLTAVLVGGVLYAVGAVGCGWGWPGEMISAIGGVYRQHERVVSGFSHISITEAVDFSVVQVLEVAGRAQAARLWTWASWGAVGLIIVRLLWQWRGTMADGSRLAARWAQVCAGMLLISPHAQYYEVALLILPVVLLVDQQLALEGGLSVAGRVLLIIGFGMFPIYGVAQWIGVQPLILLPLGVFVWADRMARAQRLSAHGTPLETIATAS